MNFGTAWALIELVLLSSGIHLAVSICGVNCETSIYHSCGKLAEGPEKSHGNHKEPGKWISAMYPGEFLADSTRQSLSLLVSVTRHLWQTSLPPPSGFCSGWIFPSPR
ncbi:hypothetical protein R6Z07F_010047 [Ovis aries]